MNKLSKYCPIFTEKSQKMAGKKNMPSAYHYVVIPVIEYILPYVTAYFFPSGRATVELGHGNVIFKIGLIQKLLNRFS